MGGIGVMRMTETKLLLAVAGGGIFSYFGQVWVWEVMAFAVAMMVVDYITGLMAGRINEGLNSRRATRGLYKKGGILFLLVNGFLLDAAFNYYIALGFNIEIPFDIPIGMIVSVWVVVTEGISILENLARLGVPIPRWLMKILKRTEADINGDL